MRILRRGLRILWRGLMRLRWRELMRRLWRELRKMLLTMTVVSRPSAAQIPANSRLM